jgi:putative hydrolase of the HAD superfamily
MHTIRAVLFDYGLVLSGAPDAAALRQMESLLHADAETFHNAYWKHRDAYDRGHLSGERYWEAVADDLHQPLDAATLAALLAADTAHWSQPNQPMVDWAVRLQRAGIKTGVLSNMGDAMEHGLRARHPWLEGFAHHTFSHRLGIAKPDAAIYQHAAEGLQVAPAEILFLDDREENVLGARAAGMIALQYSGHEAFLHAMEDGGMGRLLRV